MTIHECRIIYPGYAYKERMLILRERYRKALDREVSILESAMNRSGRELATRPELTPDHVGGDHGG